MLRWCASLLSSSRPYHSSWRQLIHPHEGFYSHEGFYWNFAGAGSHDSKYRRTLVSLHGETTLTRRGRRRQLQGSGIHHSVLERPPDPHDLLNSNEQEERIQHLYDWWRERDSVLVLTGAGLSTESGIPDYRGNNGSYHRGHKPMLHDMFMTSEYQRKRYWGRGMVGCYL